MQMNWKGEKKKRLGLWIYRSKRLEINVCISMATGMRVSISRVLSFFSFLCLFAFWFRLFVCLFALICYNFTQSAILDHGITKTNRRKPSGSRNSKDRNQPIKWTQLFRHLIIKTSSHNHSVKLKSSLHLEGTLIHII